MSAVCLKYTRVGGFWIMGRIRSERESPAKPSFLALKLSSNEARKRASYRNVNIVKLASKSGCQHPLDEGCVVWEQRGCFVSLRPRQLVGHMKGWDFNYDCFGLSPRGKLQLIIFPSRVAEIKTKGRRWHKGKMDYVRLYAQTQRETLI